MDNSNEDIMSILSGVSVRLESVAVLLQEIKMLYGLQEPPVPSEPMDDIFGDGAGVE